jgi:hypothetical protein
LIQIEEKKLIGMDTEKKMQKEWTMDIGKANLYAMTLIIPIAVILTLPFALIWGFVPIGSAFKELNYFALLYILAGIITHELLHGITWAIFAPGRFKSVKFGINWQYITPYCHCKVPLKVKHYIAGAAMPLIVLGLIPSILSAITGNALWLLFGVFFSWAAGGDIISMYAMRNLNRNTLVADHPETLGFIIVKEENEQEP